MPSWFFISQHVFSPYFSADALLQGDSSICGTREFIAPEIWEHKHRTSPGNEDGPYKAASDVYSLGMTFYEIMTHKRPFAALVEGGDTMPFDRYDRYECISRCPACRSQ